MTLTRPNLLTAGDNTMQVQFTRSVILKNGKAARKGEMMHLLQSEAREYLKSGAAVPVRGERREMAVRKPYMETTATIH